ncbi:S-methyl-5'-thioinosine phosphorylase [Oceanicoccus sp. KOV_DT_Chl]|uniref:S-methyl-5'-thioinosine phosphorylase n=1 Tax=Oceanicoccus sp. KOV_DT_Chl TaxID=1904639 RepID=UPI000C7AA061|nr:S-methyl-5'-thioinosine phosphorylase [Oceanicoccus sp. KOV_DT_Chl]
MLAIIGGTGLNDFQQGATVGERLTPYGETSAAIIQTQLNGRDVVFLARHGSPHRIPPHKVNYRANLWALKQLGVDRVLAVNAVGGIHPSMPAGAIVIPDQLVDYSYDREHTFFDGVAIGDQAAALEHVDFSYPYSASLRQALLSAAEHIGLAVSDKAVYAVTQGPRLETAAEINRLERDGCDIVGMTAMPEAVLARELGIDYASICLVVNPAAGRSSTLITMDDIHRVIASGMGR